MIAYPSYGTEAPADSTPLTCDSHTVKWHVKEARQSLKAAFARRKWRDGSPVKKQQGRIIQAHIGCLERKKDRRAIQKYRASHKTDFFRWRAYRKVTPFPGFRGEGPYLRYLAVPAYIVSCETNGYSGEGRWAAANSSGAVGPYQLLGWGAPMPAHSFRAKLAHHRIAHSLYQSQGSSPWACA